MTVIGFDVYGKPVAQGSKRLFVVNGKARSQEMGKGHGSWRDQVSEAAIKAKEQAGLDLPLDGPLRLSAIFRFPMPQSRSKAAKAAGQLPKTTAPDLGKLLRSIEDSLTAAALIRDDARIVSYDGTTKLEVWDDWTGASIRVMNV